MFLFNKWLVYLLITKGLKVQVARAPLGTVNMTWRNSVIIRVCMGI